MKKEGYYSSGEFAGLAHITKKTLRYYDEHNILKPSFVSRSGARFYSDTDFVKLQQILLFKFLGFSLDEIKELTINGSDAEYAAKTLRLQRKLICDRIDSMKLVLEAIDRTEEEFCSKGTVDWNGVLELIRLSGMEQSMKNQYQNASNISARIYLHSHFSENSQGWFPWIYEKCGIESGMHILELGCGDGSLWLENLDKADKLADTSIILSDISYGMVDDLKKKLPGENGKFCFKVIDAGEIPYPDSSFEIVIANHAMFYFENPESTCREIFRVLKPGGRLICSTYGENHMKEIGALAKEFDDRIVLEAEKLYEIFGKKNGGKLLEGIFETVEWHEYEDCLNVTEPDALASYILSCHGNQNRYILDSYREFKSYLKEACAYGFRVTKEAGLFIARKRNS